MGAEMADLSPMDRISLLRNQLSVALLNKTAMQRSASLQIRDQATDRYVRATDQIVEHLAVLNETQVLDVIEQLVLQAFGPVQA